MKSYYILGVRYHFVLLHNNIMAFVLRSTAPTRPMLLANDVQDLLSSLKCMSEFKFGENSITSAGAFDDPSLF